MGNNPMVGASVAVAVAIGQAVAWTFVKLITGRRSHAATRPPFCCKSRRSFTPPRRSEVNGFIIGIERLSTHGARGKQGEPIPIGIKNPEQAADW